MARSVGWERDGRPAAGTRVEIPARAHLPAAHKFLRGGARPSLLSRKLVPLVTAASLVLPGCGSGSGVGADATVNVYAAAPLCGEAKRELARDGGEAGGIRVRAVCLSPVEANGRLDLAQVGANARRAVEDSSTVGYIGQRSKRATRFSSPILESAEVPQLSNPSGAAAMSQLLKAIEQAGDTGGSLRQAVNDELE